jgi:hypothetical protein
MKKFLPFIILGAVLLLGTFAMLAGATVKPVDANGKTIDGQRMKIGWGRGKKK